MKFILNPESAVLEALHLRCFHEERSGPYRPRTSGQYLPGTVICLSQADGGGLARVPGVAEDEPPWVRDLDELEVQGVAGPLVQQPVVLVAVDNRAGVAREREPPGAPTTTSDPLGEFFRGRPCVKIEGD